MVLKSSFIFISILAVTGVADMASPAQRMLKVSELIGKNIYQLPIEWGKSSAIMARCYVGKKPSKHLCIPERVLMVVGVTGAGQSTLISGLVNYLYGVKHDDRFRLKLINEPPVEKACSVTSRITAYTIYHMPGFPITYTLTIVDTPGFGDTSGLERDKQITEQIKKFFSTSPENGGIDRIDGISFVAQAPLARLTHTQRYIFDSILSTFGKNIADNIFMMITFADVKKPPVVEAIKAVNIPYGKYFKFNNCALYPSAKQDDEEEEDKSDFNKMFWDMDQKSFKNFFGNFIKVNPKSLQLTNEVLEERERLETNVNGLLPQITEMLTKMVEMHKEQRILEEHRADIKEFTRTITVTKQRLIDLPVGEHVTNCLTCNRTCHHPCRIADDDEKYRCVAMDDGGKSSAKCTVCPNQCSWDRHKNIPYQFELYKEDEILTLDKLKKKYFEAKEGKAKKEDMIRVIKSRLDDVEKLVMTMITEVRLSNKRLDEIALKPNPLSVVDYIQLLIEAEKQEHAEGWLEHVQYLQECMKKAKLTQAATKDEGLQQQIKQAKANRLTMWQTVKYFFNTTYEG